MTYEYNSNRFRSGLIGVGLMIGGTIGVPILGSEMIQGVYQGLTDPNVAGNLHAQEHLFDTIGYGVGTFASLGAFMLGMRKLDSLDVDTTG